MMLFIFEWYLKVAFSVWGGGVGGGGCNFLFIFCLMLFHIFCFLNCCLVYFCMFEYFCVWTVLRNDIGHLLLIKLSIVYFYMIITIVKKTKIIFLFSIFITYFRLEKYKRKILTLRKRKSFPSINLYVDQFYTHFSVFFFTAIYYIRRFLSENA